MTERTPRIRRSMIFSVGDRYVTIICNLAATTILARVLTPVDFGIVAIAVGILGLVEAFREFGVGAFLIQAHIVNNRDLRTASTMSFLLASLVASIVILLSHPIAQWYGDPRLSSAIPLMACGLIVAALSGPPMAVLRRNLDFGKVALANISGALAQFVISIGLAVNGCGYMSLVLGMLSGQIAILIAAVYLGPGTWIYRPSIRGYKTILAFGGWSSATISLNTLYSLGPQLLIGRFVGLDAAGMYSRAMLLCQLQDKFLFTGIIPVILPAFAREVRHEKSLKQQYLHAVDLSLVVQWPFLIFMIINADEIILVALGDQWKLAIPIFRILCLGYLTMFAAFLTYPTLVACGRVRDTLTASLISLPPSFLIIAVATIWGSQAVATAVALTLGLQMFVALHFTKRALQFKWIDIVEKMRDGLKLTLLTNLASILPLLLGLDNTKNPFVYLTTAGFSAIFGMIVGLFLLRHVLLYEIGLFLPMAFRESFFEAMGSVYRVNNK